MQLTDEQLADVKDNYLAQQKPIRDWMTDNNLNMQDIKPREVIQQLNTKYTVEVIRPLLLAMRESNMGNQFTRMATRMCSRPGITVERCNQLLASLQDAVITVSAKKAELEG